MVVEQKLLSWIITVIIIIPVRVPLEIGGANAKPLVPCYFVFGDSLVDSGNNNLLISYSKANFWPNGIDFPNGVATGRFCNGRTTVDILGQLLGFDEFIPPFATASGKQIFRGVNYASSTSGIRDDTGSNLGERISFSQQVNNFKTTVSQVANMLGSLDMAADHLSRCIYVIDMGTNDYADDYFLPFTPTSSKYTPNQFAYLLVQKYSAQLEILRNYGARKFALMGIGPVGYQPGKLVDFSPDGKTPVQIFNFVVEIFNQKLKKKVVEMNDRYLDSNFIYLNVYDIVRDILTHANTYGFKVINSACCGLGRNRAEIPCPHDSIPCRNRSDHFFWDAFHPTEAANIFISKRFFRAQNPTDAYPFDIHRLALLRNHFT